MAHENVWPEYLMIRDTGLHDDMGGGGQRIYTTAGRGYEKRKYVRDDLAALSLPVSNTDIDRTSEPKGHWEDGGKVWVEDHVCCLPGEWQPIETAPKDGEAILLYKPDERRVGEYMLAGYWGEWPGQEDGWIACNGKPLGYFSQWEGKPQGYPTHWQPLPEAPL